MYSIAIIILNWNGGIMLKDCIDSIKKNTPSIYKIFIIDNGSTDDSLKNIKETNSISIIKNKKNEGFVGGNNQGVDIAFKDNPNIKYILLLNNDTKVSANWIQPLINTIIQKPNIGIVGPKQLNFDGATVNAAGHINILSNKYYSDNDIKEVDWLMGSCLLIKVEVIKKIGLFDEIYSPAFYEETDFEARAIKNGYKNYYCGKSLIYHKGGASVSSDPDKFSRIFYRNRMIYFLKHNPLGLFPRIYKDTIEFYKKKKLRLLFGAYKEGLLLYLK